MDFKISIIYFKPLIITILFFFKYPINSGKCINETMKLLKPFKWSRNRLRLVLNTWNNFCLVLVNINEDHSNKYLEGMLQKFRQRITVSYNVYIEYTGVLFKSILHQLTGERC